MEGALEQPQRTSPRKPGEFRAENGLGERPSSSRGNREPLEERLEKAAQRREEFRLWVTAKAKSKRVTARNEDQRSKLQKIKERQQAAEQARDRLLEEVRQKAAAVDIKRETALHRLHQRQEELAQRVAQSLSAAEERRNAILEAERERLRAEHSLVLTRLALSKEDTSPNAEAARRKLEERLALAEEQRQQRLAQASARAGSKVQRAKAVSALTKQLAKQQAMERLEHLQTRLESAKARRLAHKAAGSPTSPKPVRISVNGSVCITSPPLTAENSKADLNADSTPPPSSAAKQGHISTSVHPEPPATQSERAPATPPPRTLAISTRVSDRLLAEVDSTLTRAHSLPQPLKPVTETAATAKAGTAGRDEKDGDSEGKAEEGSETGERQSSTVPLSPEEGGGMGEREVRLEQLRRSASTRRLQAAWRQFSKKQRTTAALAQAFAEKGLLTLHLALRTPPASPASQGAGAATPPPPGPAVLGMPSPGTPSTPRGASEFDAFARVMQAPATLRSASVLLRRLESRLMLRGRGGEPHAHAHETHHHHLDKAHHGHGVHVKSSGHAHHHHAGHHAHGGRGKSAVTTGGASERNVTRILRRLYPDLPKDRIPDRYPPRIFLCSLMILHYPEVVFNGTGERESKLSEAAREMVKRFERLLERIMAPTTTQAAGSPAKVVCASPVAQGMEDYLRTRGSAGAAGVGGDEHVTIAQRLVEFDEAWLQYLDQFAAWKLEDAASLETELIRVAAEMERSLQRKLRRSASSPPGTTPRSGRNLDNLVAQVRHDYDLLRDRVERLSGASGLARLDSALSAVREQVAMESASEFDSEMESASDVDPSTPPARGQAAAQAARTRSAPAPRSGIRRGFFASPAISTTPYTTQDATPVSMSQSATPSASSPTHAPRPETADTAASQPPQVVVTDVRAPSVPRSPTSGGGSVPASPGAGPADSAALADSIANLQMVWELLHNPAHKVNTGEAEGAWTRALAPADAPLPKLEAEELESLPAEAAAERVRDHARAVAETVFWENVTNRIKQGLLSPGLSGLISTVIPLIKELGQELAEVIPQGPTRTALESEFSEDTVSDALTGTAGGAGGALAALAGRLQRLATLLVSNGAPAREAASRAAHAALASQLGTEVPAALGALAAGDAGASAEVAALATTIARAFMLLLAELKLLKIDAANARMNALTQQVKGDGGITYLRNKFGSIHSLPSGWDTTSNATLLGQRLPRTRAWLDRAGAAASGIHGYLLTAAQVDLNSDALLAAAAQAAADAAGARAVPVTLRAGLRATGGAAPSSGTGPAVATPTPAPAKLRTWQGVVRTGVVALVSSDKPAVGPALAETLAWDAERIHAAQNAFQQLVVVTAALLLVQQTRARAGRPALPPADAAAARKRLMVVLSDPSMSLTGLVSELYRLATSDATTPAADAVAEEAALGTAFRALMNPSSAAFTSISNALAAALSLHLLLGSAAVAADAGGSAGAVAAVLGRVGAATMADDVASLAQKLATLCAVSENVFGPVYASLDPLTSQSSSQEPQQSQ